jgi:hypothetical protein
MDMVGIHRFRYALWAFILSIGIAYAAWGQAGAERAIKVDSFALFRNGTLYSEFSVYRLYGCLFMSAHPDFNSGVSVKALVGMRKAGSGAWKILGPDGGLAEPGAQENAAFGRLGATSGLTLASRMAEASRPEYDLSLPGKQFQYASSGSASAASGSVPRGALPVEQGEKRFLLADLGQAAALAEGGNVQTAIIVYGRLGASIQSETAFSLVWKPEYFKGESALRASSPLAGIAYGRAARAILHSVWQAFPAEQGLELSAPESKVRTALGYAMSTDILRLYSQGRIRKNTASEAKVSYPLALGIDYGPVCARIYGQNGNPYLSAYLGMHYLHQKPLYSRGIAAAEKDAYSADYSYAAYSAISSAQGEALAAAAMRYYLWGLEYTSGDAGRDSGQTRVFGENAARVQAWLSGAPGSASDKNHYQGQLQSLNRATLPPSRAADIALLALVDPGFLLVPFARGQGGNPLPFVKGGVDSPRTFAYKMVEQRKTREAMRAAAVPESTKGFKLGDAALAGPEKTEYYWRYGAPSDMRELPRTQSAGGLSGPQGVMRPFTPFIPMRGETKVEMVAGVDASGFLLGCVAMTDFRNSFQGAGGSTPAASLDAYNAMLSAQAAVPGLDAAGKPLFAVTAGQLGVGSGDYRLQRPVLERASFIVPSLGLARVGDIVARFGVAEEAFGANPESEDDPLDLGVVVKAGGSENDILVVRLSQRLGRVSLSRLSDAGPAKGYHIRRLLVSAPRPSENPRPEWDLLDGEPATLALRIDTSDLKPKNERWIPNTGEYREFRIAVEMANCASTSLKLRDYLNAHPDIALCFAPPVDRGFDGAKPPASHGNVYVNQGAGFELAARPANGFEAEAGIPLLRFIRRDSEAEYAVEAPPGSIMKSDGGLKPGYAWACEFSKGANAISIVKQGSAIRYSVFGLRPISSGAIRPGDDILLSMSLKKTNVEPNPAILAGSSAESEYLAVYDKMMLWRANLYVEESQEDWNRSHPWNAPPDAAADIGPYPAWGKNAEGTRWVWGYNEWNRGYGVSARYSENALPTAPQEKKGAQTLSLSPFTWIDGNVKDKAVAYSIGCHDSPFEFNHKMDQQKALLSNGFAAHIAPYNKKTGNQGNANYKFNGWTSTKAPEAGDLEGGETPAWKNYRHGADGIAVSAGTGLPSGYPAGTYYPYRPGYSSQESQPSDLNRARSSGVDCVGLVVRSLSYANSPYLHPNKLSTWLWGEAAPARSFPAIADGPNGMKASLWKIAKWDEVKKIKEVDGREKEIPKNLEMLIPGDVIYYPGHVMMVASVERSSTGDVRPEGVKIIEATNVTFTWNIHFVSKKNSLQSYSEGTMDRNWMIGRLR